MRNYDPMKDGAITAIRIYYASGSLTPMAELALAFGGTATIQWNNVEQREAYSSGINGYTYIFDERIREDFQSFIR